MLGELLGLRHPRRVTVLGGARALRVNILTFEVTFRLCFWEWEGAGRTGNGGSHAPPLPTSPGSGLGAPQTH